jgi:beta-galactosidase
VFDWEALWALESSCGPGHLQPDKGYRQLMTRLYRPLWERGVGVDLLGRHDDWSGYRFLVLPMLFLVEPVVAARVRDYVAGGGAVLATWLTGIVDENNLCHSGWPGGGLREVFGVWAEELDVLHEHDVQEAEFVAGNALGLTGRYRVDAYADLLHLEGAAAAAVYGHDFYAGRPALTCHRVGKGEAWYLAAEIEPAGLDAVIGAVARRTGVRQLLASPRSGLTVQSRSDGLTEWLFILNFSAEERQVDLGPCADQETGRPLGSPLTVTPWGSAVVRRSNSPGPPPQQGHT